MDQSLPWNKSTIFEEIESFGILAGEDNGNKVYVGRVIDKDGNFVPAKIVPALKSSFFVYNDEEEESDQFDFLDHCNDFHWVRSADANLDEAAEISGQCIGRGTYNGNVIVGSVDSSSKKLIGAYDGKAFELPSYDVLIYKSKGVVYETIQKASNVSKQKTTQVFAQSISINGSFEESKIDGQSYLIQKIRQLEMEKLSYIKDYDARLNFEQRKVVELSHNLKQLRMENSQFQMERRVFEEKFSNENQKFSSLESKVQEFALNNSYLLKKVTSLEEAIRIEKHMIESVAEKLANSESYNKTLLTRVKSSEETIKISQKKIFELEGDLMASSSSDSLMIRLSEYEETIKHLRIQIESIMKRLEITSNDNEFLIQKLEMLMKTLRSYQSQIDCLTNKLQSAKTVIAAKHSDLSRANAQVSKYEGALSSCYTLNGELMTKVSGLNAVTQNQIGSDCSFNLIDYSSFSLEKSSRKTSTLLQLTGSRNYLNFNESVPMPQPAQAQAYGTFQTNGNGVHDNETAI